MKVSCVLAESVRFITAPYMVFKEGELTLPLKKTNKQKKP